MNYAVFLDFNSDIKLQLRYVASNQIETRFLDFNSDIKLQQRLKTNPSCRAYFLISTLTSNYNDVESEQYAIAYIS